jgi:hypothetical protein
MLVGSVWSLPVSGHCWGYWWAVQRILANSPSWCSWNSHTGTFWQFPTTCPDLCFVHMMSLHTKEDAQMGTPLCTHISTLFPWHHWVGVLPGTTGLSLDPDWAISALDFSLHIPSLNIVRYAFISSDKSGRVLGNGMQFGVYEKSRAVLQAKRNVTKLTYVSPPFSQYLQAAWASGSES